jgi:hypothetical protein
MINDSLTAELTPVTDRERRLMDVIEKNNAHIGELDKELRERKAYCDLLLDRLGQNTTQLKADMLDALRDIGNDDFDKEVIAHALIGFDYLLIKLAFREVDGDAT